MTGFSSPEDWVALFSAAPGLGVAIHEADSTILYVNETIVRWFGGGTAEEHVGKRLVDLYPPEWARAKEALFKRVAETDERLLVRYIWDGNRVEAQYQRIPNEAGGAPRVLVTVRQGVTQDELIPEGFEVIKIDTSNFGPLKVLTPREIEVLALIGQGKTAKEIGETLGCSPRTVERPRDSIGKKLDKHDRVSLALVAQAAGLELRDAHVKHVDPIRSPPTPPKPASEAECKPEPGRVSRPE